MLFSFLIQLGDNLAYVNRFYAIHKFFVYVFHLCGMKFWIRIPIKQQSRNTHKQQNQISRFSVELEDSANIWNMPTNMKQFSLRAQEFCGRICLDGYDSGHMRTCDEDSSSTVCEQSTVQSLTCGRLKKVGNVWRGLRRGCAETESRWRHGYLRRAPNPRTRQRHVLSLFLRP